MIDLDNETIAKLFSEQISNLPYKRGETKWISTQKKM